MRSRYLFQSLIFVVAALSLFARTSVANSAKDVHVLSCPSAVHVADFKTCVQNWQTEHGAAGLEIATNPNQALSAYVRITGTWTPMCVGGPCRYLGGTLNPVRPDGTALVNDSDLTVIDQGFFAQARVASAVNEVIDIPTDYGGSYVGSMDEDTNSA